MAPLRLLALLLLSHTTTTAALKRLAIVTGGTRGIGRGISDALDDFQADLSDEQKAAFEAIGPKRGA